ncbi:MAG: YebC/PmpR family DNA-binding transcriptional regulator [Phycisphaera sp.]|nr:YebC/PmpR family DNA-binding transcriptional regulator [Phycisphaera sp.]
MAGHSRWANIKHKKAKSDAKKGKLWSKCARAIIVAAKNGGGDPAANLTLRYAIDDAKAANMPRDTIDNAVKKGTGELGAESYESALYEGYGPGGVAILLEILTDNRNRTAPEVRKIFEKAGGNLGGAGCVAYMFQSKGQIFVNRGADEEQLMTVALDAGAQDITDEGETWQVLCEPAAFIRVREALEKAGMTVESASLTMIPDTTVTCTGEDARKILNMVEALEDHDDIQKVHANFDVPEEELAALE